MVRVIGKEGRLQWAKENEIKGGGSWRKTTSPRYGGGVGGENKQSFWGSRRKKTKDGYEKRMGGVELNKNEWGTEKKEKADQVKRNEKEMSAKEFDAFPNVNQKRGWEGRLTTRII